MSMHFWKRFGLLALLLLLRAESAVADGEGQPGASTPQQAVRKYMLALWAGDAEAVASCFDQADVYGRAAVELHQQVAEMVAATRRLEQLAKEKFGDAGVRALRNDLPIHVGPMDVQRLDEYLKREAVLFQREGVDSAFVLLQGADEIYWRLRRTDARWYIAMSKHQVQLAALFGGIATPTRAYVDKAATVVNQSNTLDELTLKLAKLREEAYTKDVLEQLGPPSRGRSKGDDGAKGTEQRGRGSFVRYGEHM